MTCFRCNNSGRAGAADFPRCPVCFGSGDAERPTAPIAPCNDPQKYADDLEITAAAAAHTAAINYCDGLIAAGKPQREAMLAAMGCLIGEGSLIAHAAGLSAEDFQQVAAILYGRTEELARETQPARK
jgi:hypothetical protein